MKRALVVTIAVLSAMSLIVAGSASGAPSGLGLPSLRTERVSVASDGTEVGRDSLTPAVSDDGRIVAFYSKSPKLVPGDTNGESDVFVHDRDSGITERVSVSSTGEEGNGLSFIPELSGDGRFVAFQSLATNFVEGDTNDGSDIFVHDRETGTTELVSVGSNGEVGNFFSFQSALSQDGRFIAFASFAGNLTDGPNGDGADVFVRDMQEGTTELVSIGLNGEPANFPDSFAPSISADGSIVAFDSDATNLVEGDTNSAADSFVRNMTTRVTVRVSVNSQGSEGRWGGVDPELTADGGAVLFTSESRLAPGDTGRSPDAFVHDLGTGKTKRVSRAMGGELLDREAFGTGISDDGRFASFVTAASNVVPGDTNEDWDHFRYDRQTGVTVRISVNSRGRQAKGDKGIYIQGEISGDGRFYVWESAATNLVRNDENNKYDVFIRGPYGDG
jgi:Tol biopolymer transport system component